MSAQPHDPYDAEIAELDRRAREVVAQAKADGRAYDAQWPGMTRAEIDEQAWLDTFGEQVPDPEHFKVWLTKLGVAEADLEEQARHLAADTAHRRDQALARRAAYRNQ